MICCRLRRKKGFFCLIVSLSYHWVCVVADCCGCCSGCGCSGCWVVVGQLSGKDQLTAGEDSCSDCREVVGDVDVIVVEGAEDIGLIGVDLGIHETVDIIEHPPRVVIPVRLGSS